MWWVRERRLQHDLNKERKLRKEQAKRLLNTVMILRKELSQILEELKAIDAELVVAKNMDANNNTDKVSYQTLKEDNGNGVMLVSTHPWLCVACGKQIRHINVDGTMERIDENVQQ